MTIYDAEAREAALIKGGAIRELLLWYEGRHGRAFYPLVIARLPPHLAQRLALDRTTLGLLPNVWYPSPIVHAILDAVCERHGPDELRAIMSNANAYAVRTLTRGVYQFLFRMVGSPELYAKHIQRAWNLLHSTGKGTIVLHEGPSASGVAESMIEDWPGHHPWLCETTGETMKAVFVAMGCQDVSLERLTCVSTGADRCRSVLRYRDR
jgi:hypothetical protein